MGAATNLVSTVEAHGTIRPGVTERTLQDLQFLVDTLEETANNIKNEPIVSFSEPKNDDVDMKDDDDGGHGDDHDVGRGDNLQENKNHPK